MPVKEELINELLAAWVHDASTSSAPKGAAGPAPDLTMLMRSVRRVAVQAGPGVITLDFEIRV